MRSQSPPPLSVPAVVAFVLLAAPMLHAQQLRSSSNEPPSLPTTVATPPSPLLRIPSLRSDAAPSKATIAAQTVAEREFAVKALTDFVEKYRQAGDRSAEAHTLSALGSSYINLHQYQKALEQFQSALTIWRDLGNKEFEASSLAHIGDVYRQWGFPDHATGFYRDSLKFYQEDSNSVDGAVVMNNLGLTYILLGDGRKSVEYLDKALKFYRAKQDRRGEALALANLASAFGFVMNDPHKALDFFQESITKLELLDDRAAEANTLELSGVIWMRLGKPDMAKLTFQHALALYGALRDAKGEASAERHMAMIGQHNTVASIH